MRKESRKEILSAMGAVLQSDLDYQLQIIKIKEISRLNQKYGYEVCDAIVEKFQNILQELIPTICSKSQVFHLKGCTFISISPIYSVSELKEHGVKIYQAIDEFTADLLQKTDVIRCHVATIPLPKNCNVIYDNVLSKMEYYFHHNFEKREDIFQYDETFFASLVRQSEIRLRLQDALLNKKIKFHFQPQYNKDDQIVGFESLARWQDECLGIIPPNEFIPEFEHSMFYDDFCNYAIEQSLGNFAQLRQNGFANTSISINIMKGKFKDTELPHYLTQIATQYEIPFEQIILEITETAFSESDVVIANNIKKLRERGFKLSIDDFGTGNASFARLIQLDFDELKLDRSFANMMVTADVNDKANLIMSSLCKFCHDSVVKVVFEGIETKEQRDFVFKQLEVDMIQGFYYSKPMPLKQLVAND